MPARLSAFIIWALVAATVAFWGLRLLARAPQAPLHTVAVSGSPVARGDLSRLLGAPPAVAAAAAPEVASRFKLAGVMAPKTAGTEGVALIAIDGKSPRAFAVGASLGGDLVLQAVSLRTASIGPVQGSPAVVLEIPPLAPAATGTLSPAAADAPAAATAPPPPPPAANRPAPRPLARPVPSR